jgi:hypothetical protein
MDGRAVYLEERADTSWHVIAGRSTLAVLPTRECALDFVEKYFCTENPTRLSSGLPT